ncbi:fibronectin type III domain-containing protein [Streptomyces lincolnensis]|uniref:fibronectin type III domain-containing protein n=1 Tax=Streptomyces lincolnensis TaxID=1915 RepID=UPI0037CD6017
MRHVPPPVPPLPLRRHLALCGALVLVASCGWSAADEDASGGAPGAPLGVTATAGSATSVHVMWNAVSASAGIDVYEVYRGTTKVEEVPGSRHMVDVIGLRPSTPYVFSVRARDTDGRLGPGSREVRATTPAAGTADDSAPTRPAGLRARAVGSRAVQLSWSASSDDRGVVSYDIHQGGAKIHSVGGAQRAAVVTGLRPGTRYSFTVRARDAADNASPASTPAPVTTPGTDDGRHTAPTGFRATTHRADGAFHMDLSWVPPRTDGVIAEYQIHLDGRPATSLVYGGSAPGGREATHSFYLGPDSGVTHWVRIRARLPDGTWGGFSAERTVTTGS